MRHCILLLSCFCSVACCAQIKTAAGHEIAPDAMTHLLQAQMDSLDIPGVSIAIINDGKIIYEQALGFANKETGKKVDSSTIFECASMSKTVFAWLVLKLRQDGLLKLNMERPVYEYYPYPDIAYDNRYKLITPRMLLTHTSGFPNWRGNEKLSIKFTPGTQYSYSGEGFEYLAYAVESLTHTTATSIDSLMQLELVKPLGIVHFSFVKNDYLAAHKAVGYNHDSTKLVAHLSEMPDAFHPAYGLHTTPREYAKFLIAMMENKGLNKANTDTMLTPKVNVTNNGKPTDHYYGYGIGIDST
ncbi:MAG TPA: serine hydrolase domain-containing protein, partial [Chitinophagaceae bacterium]|nr:serine hydrolase domain-containing protein [Chitinophagaceae bacterium]